MVDVSWFGGLLEFTIPTYVIIGVILIIIGVLLGAFVPNVGKKFGTITFIVGLIMAIGFPLIADWWQNDIFKAVVIGVGVLGIILYILFSDIEPTKGGRKR